MADIWGRTIQIGSILQGETVRASFSYGTPPVDAGLLVMRAQYAAERQISQVFNLQNGEISLLTQLPSLPIISLTGIVTSSNTYKDFLSAFGTMCGTTDLKLEITHTKCGGGGATTTMPVTLTYTLKGARIVRLNGAVSNEQFVVVSEILLAGTHLEVQ